MIRLKNIVKQMEQDQYNEFAQTLVNGKAGKFHSLLECYKQNDLSENEIMESIEVNKNAYYTLKSRLYDKLQEYLIDNIEGPKTDLLRKVAAIPKIIHSASRETAIATLTKLEQDLREYDMAYELISVYSALKKLHINSPKYYQYDKAYNKHVAYTLAQDKLEDLLGDFNKTLGRYYLSRNSESIEILTLLKQEIANICELHDSHHMYVYQGIANISYSLFVPSCQMKTDATENDEPVEDMLVRISTILKNYPIDITYQLLDIVFNFLSFEYYHSLNVHKKETEYFDTVNENIGSFLLYNVTTFPSKFLVSKVRRYKRLNIEDKLFEEDYSLLENMETDQADIPNYVSQKKYMAYASFYAGNVDDAIGILNNLLNEISLREYSHTEIEIKLSLALFYSFVNEYNLATNLIRSASRKIREFEDRDYENVRVFIKMLQTPMKSNAKNVEDHLLKLRDRFELLNNSEYKIMDCLKMDDVFIKQLSRAIK
ncbi:MAG: hypothetical protein IH946_01885 [Bacteroidetes bacterium]|nr:hypothetical protein [Bacteroidota bacterium]